MAGVLYFDGECAMCTRARDLLVRLNRTGDVLTVPLQQPGTAQKLGIAPARLGESVWWLSPSGAVCGGARAVNAALGAARGTGLPLAVYGIPGMARVQEALYRWVAANRSRFPGTTPFCTSHQAQCR